MLKNDDAFYAFPYDKEFNLDRFQVLLSLTFERKGTLWAFVQGEKITTPLLDDDGPVCEFFEEFDHSWHGNIRRKYLKLSLGAKSIGLGWEKCLAVCCLRQELSEWLKETG